MPPKNFKGRSPNVLAFLKKAGREEDLSSVLPGNLVAGQNLAAKNQGRSLESRGGNCLLSSGNILPKMGFGGLGGCYIPG